MMWQTGVLFLLCLLCLLVCVGAEGGGKGNEQPSRSSQLRAKAANVCLHRFQNVTTSLSGSIEQVAADGYTGVSIYFDQRTAVCDMPDARGPLLNAITQELCAPAQNFYVQCDPHALVTRPGAPDDSPKVFVVAIMFRGPDDARPCACQYTPSTAPTVPQ